MAPAVPGQSRNWSGYVASGTKEFDCVEATWIQPTIGCRSSSTVSAVYWVGLGGYGQEALVQIGTESTCTQGEASAAVWRQSLPDERYSIRASLDISEGDRIWAQARWLSGSRYRLALSDLTTRGHFAIEITNTALKRSSAEWIVESPSGGCPDHCRTLKMPNFSTFRFRTAWATIGGVRRQVDAAPAEHTLETMVSRDRCGPGGGHVDGGRRDVVRGPLAPTVGGLGGPSRPRRRGWWSYGDSNPGPPACHAGALPAEL